MYLRIITLATLLATSMHLSAQEIGANYKGFTNGNPISACVFCADPTALEYHGRLYVYGTNDNQQYLKNNKKGSNGYGDIKSLVVFSTDDMVNWTFHGTIDVGKVCGSWCGQSWAPSAVWRTTDDGKEEFFIYFANGGGSVGVIKGESPIGPFMSPRNSAMIQHGMSGVDPCNWLFDPGAVIDANGTGWIAFGGGDPQSTGSKLWPGNSRIAKLKPSLTALDGAAVNMPAPYLFEASELNIIGGRFVYTYNTSWSDRNDWNKFKKSNGQPAPSSCSMCYMVSDTPLDPDSWEYRGEYVPNEGNFGMGWGNNHTHLHKFQDNYYLFYHSTLLEQTMKDAKAMNSDASGYRSIGVNKATVDEENQTIKKMSLNKSGVNAIKNLNPYALRQAETMANSGGVMYQDFKNIEKNTEINTLGNDASRNLQIKMRKGTWTMVRNAAFGEDGAKSFMLRANGTGKMEIRLDKITAEAAATVEFSSIDIEDHVINIDPEVFNGTHSVFFVFTEADSKVQFDAWCFSHDDASGITPIRTAKKTSTLFDLNGHRLTDGTPYRGVVIEQYQDENGKMRSRKRVSTNTVH